MKCLLLDIESLQFFERGFVRRSFTVDPKLGQRLQLQEN